MDRALSRLEAFHHSIPATVMPTPATNFPVLLAAFPKFVSKLDPTRSAMLLDTRPEAWKGTDRWPQHLVYRYLDNNETVMVPNIFDNRPTAWQAAELRREANHWRQPISPGMCRKCVTLEPGDTCNWAIKKARRLEERAEELLAWPLRYLQAA